MHALLSKSLPRNFRKRCDTFKPYREPCIGLSLFSEYSARFDPRLFGNLCVLQHYRAAVEMGKAADIGIRIHKAVRLDDAEVSDCRCADVTLRKYHRPGADHCLRLDVRVGGDDGRDQEVLVHEHVRVPAADLVVADCDERAGIAVAE